MRNIHICQKFAPPLPPLPRRDNINLDAEMRRDLREALAEIAKLDRQHAVTRAQHRGYGGL